MIAHFLEFLLMQGQVPVIRLDKKTMLIKVIGALGSSSPPLFSEVECGGEGVKVSIKLDLSFDAKDSVCVVEGAAFMSKSAAKNDAVFKAFRHLDENCGVRVLDFSSRVARSYGSYNTYTYVNESLGLAEKIIDKFETSLTKCMDFAWS